MSRPHLPWCALADDHEGMCNDEPLRSRATHDASTDPVPRLEWADGINGPCCIGALSGLACAHQGRPEPVVMGQRYSNDWGPLEPALDPERIHMQAKAQRALESVPPLVGPDATRKDWEEVVAWAREAVRESDRPLTAEDFLVTPEVLEIWKTGARATSLREHIERAKALGDVFEAFTLEAKEQAVAAGLAFIAKRDAAWRKDLARASASCWQCEAALGTTEGCMTCSAKRREDNPEEVR